MSMFTRAFIKTLVGSTAMACLLMALPATAQIPAPAVTGAPNYTINRPDLPLHKPVSPAMIKDIEQKMSLYLAQGKNPDNKDQLASTGVTPSGMPAPVGVAGKPVQMTPLTRAALDVGSRLMATAPITRAATATTGAPVATVCPNTYDALSKSANTVLPAAFTAMAARDIPSLKAQLPGLEAALTTIPLKPIAPEVCNDHVNVFTQYQYTKLSVLKQAGAPTGLPANLPLIKYPELPLPWLAYAVGWTKYELGDFDGAFLAYARGLIIDPNNYPLANEYCLTLFELGRYTDVLGFTETFLTQTHDLTDEQRAVLFFAHGVALLKLGYGEAGEQALLVAYSYDPSNEDVIRVLKSLYENKPKTGAGS